MRILAAFTAFALSTAPTLAADAIFPNAPSPKHASAERHAGTHDWTGAYIGATIGAHVTDGSAEIGSFQGAIISDDIRGGLFQSEVGESEATLLKGVRAGYDHQIGHVVLGARVSAMLLDAGDGSRYSAVDDITRADPLLEAALRGTTTTSAFESRIEGLVMAEFVGGVAVGKAKVYGTAGIAMGRVKNVLSIGISPSAFFPGYQGTFSGKDELFGYTVGGGVEYAFNEKLSVSVDYTYYDLEDQTVRAADEVFFPGEHMDYEYANDGHLTRVGVNYRF